MCLCVSVCVWNEVGSLLIVKSKAVRHCHSDVHHISHAVLSELVNAGISSSVHLDMLSSSPIKD